MSSPEGRGCEEPDQAGVNLGQKVPQSNEAGPWGGGAGGVCGPSREERFFAFQLIEAVPISWLLAPLIFKAGPLMRPHSDTGLLPPLSMLKDPCDDMGPPR